MPSGTALIRSMLRCVLPCPVKGAGVAGLAVVHALVARGAEITVFDPHPGFSAAASWLAGGMLAPWCERESADEAVLREGQDAPDRWEAMLPGVVKRNGTLNDRAGTEGRKSRPTCVVVTTQPPQSDRGAIEFPDTEVRRASLSDPQRTWADTSITLFGTGDIAIS